MMRFGCGAHIMGHGHHHQTADPDHDTATGKPSLPIGEAIDPVCGRSVQTLTAKTSAYHGGIYYFCSQKCRETFEAAPESFAKTVNAGSHDKEHHHGCC
jgi:YHS domain-containing protein